MYIAPSSGHTSLNFNMPFKLVIRRFEVVLWYMSGVRMLHFLKDWWKFIQIHQCYTKLGGKWLFRMDSVYRVLWILKNIDDFREERVFSEIINIFEKFKKQTYGGGCQLFYHRYKFIAPSIGHSLLTLNLSFQVILRRSELVFWCLEWEYCTFWKVDENSFKPTNTILCKCHNIGL